MSTAVTRPASGATDLNTLKGVGPAMRERLERLGLQVAEDLLFHLPLRYQDRTRVTPIAALRAGHEAVVEGEVTAADVIQGRRRSLLVRLRDGSGIMSLRFFHFSQAQVTQFTRGARMRLFGEARSGSTGLEMYHPEYRLLKDEPQEVEETLTPIYPTTEGLAQPRLRALIRQAFEHLDQGSLHLDELIPEHIRTRFRLPALRESLDYLHFPPPDAPLETLADGHHPTQRRLALEELLAHQLSLYRIRLRIQDDAAPALPASGGHPQR